MHIYQIYMICKHILLKTVLNESVIFFSQLNGFEYFYLTQIILYTAYHLSADS